MVSHVEHFVKETGYWVLLREEKFEHFQQTGNFLRLRHSNNVPNGAQICSTLQYDWLRTFSEVTVLQAEEEELGIQNGSNLRKRRFSQTK